MAQKIKEARKLVWDNLKDCQIIFLATVDSDCAKVRPVTLMRKGNDLFTVSMVKNSKVDQIRKNSKVEFVFCIPDVGFNAIRVECTAEVVEDEKVKSEIYDSPEHALIRLIPTKFTVLMPPEFENVSISPT
jgi:general stress protein 26